MQRARLLLKLHAESQPEQAFGGALTPQEVEMSYVLKDICLAAYPQGKCIQKSAYLSSSKFMYAIFYLNANL